jgi:4-alpha-glucanotransferase
MNKIYDSWDVNYKKPFGALTKGQKCRFSISLPKTLQLDFPPVMVFYRNGFKERFLNMVIVSEEDGYNIYATEFVAKHVDVHYYYFAITTGGIRSFIKKTNRHIGVINGEDVFQLTVFDPEFTTPDFLKGGIMYQIFPDRFCKSGTPKSDIPTGRVLRKDWEGTPEYKPDVNGHVWNNDYFGGDLEGIRQKLPYLKDLGVTCIYLNPIFESHENHRYNTANYRKIDPLLGTNEEFKNLCAEAKEMGVSIILDGVFSHTGADSVYFNKFNRYDTVGAYNSQNSEFYPWYSFQKFPDKYDAWWGLDTLPNVRETNPQYLDYICGEGGVLDYWLDMGAAGWRLDVADELPDKFLDALRRRVKANAEKTEEDKLIIGEVWEDASNKQSYGVNRRYLLGMQLDSVMNYPFKDAISSFVCGGSAEDFIGNISTIIENYPQPSIDVLMNSLSTHDIERAINRFGGDFCYDKTKEWMAENYLTPQQYELGKNRLKCAMVLQFFLPGVPCIYYGDEIGMQGYKDPFNRRCFTWDKSDSELVEFTKLLSDLRKSCDVFKNGALRFLLADNDIIAFARVMPDYEKACAIFLNRSDKVQALPKDKNVFNYNTYDYLDGKSQDGVLYLNPYGFAFSTVDNPVKSVNSEEESDNE